MENAFFWFIKLDTKFFWYVLESFILISMG